MQLYTIGPLQLDGTVVMDEPHNGSVHQLGAA